MLWTDVPRDEVEKAEVDLQNLRSNPRVFGRQAQSNSNGAESNPLVLGLGIAATLGAISFAGNIATDALKDLDLDLSED